MKSFIGGNYKKPKARPKLELPELKKKILYWGDGPTVTTGFGTTTKHLLAGLQATGKYEIDVVGINFNGDFYDQKEFPYRMVPGRLKDPEDPYGRAMVVDYVLKGDYDYLFIMNDTFVADTIVEKLKKVFDEKTSKHQKIPRVVFYYPVDCRIIPGGTKMIQLADYSACYSEFGKEQTKIAGVDCDSVIPLGVDTDAFAPIPTGQRILLRQKFLNVFDDETFVWINVNRNSFRKDVSKTIIAFSQFRQLVPNSILYLHMAPVDHGAGRQDKIDLRVPIDHLNIGDWVRFPQNFSTSSGFSVNILNQLYNCADGFITTHNGEGFGLTQLEAMACGLPVIAPDNTNTRELLGQDGECGYIYPCRELVHIDGSGVRKTGRIEDIANAMLHVYQERHEGDGLTKRARAARKARTFTWTNTQSQWVKVFADLNSNVITKKTDAGVSL